MPIDARDVADVTTDPATAATEKTAVLYRMALPGHLCPSGQKARWLLKSKGYDVDDRLFRTRPEVDAFKEEYGVSTTPQAWIEGKRVGGYSAVYRLSWHTHMANARLVHFGLNDPTGDAEASRY